MSNVLIYALQVLNILPQLLQAGKDIGGILETANTALKAMQENGRDPSAEEWAALNAQIDMLRKDLHSPKSAA